jgi:hypothetical protein
MAWLAELPALSLYDATRASEWLIALAVALQTLELLQLRRSLADDGVWRWSTLRTEHAVLSAPLRGLLRLALPYRAFMALLGLRLTAALALCAVSRWELLLFLWFTQIASGARFRGAFNGGSDAMTSLILMALSFAALTRPEPLGAKAGLAYIAVQLTLSYVIAGLTKLKEPSWRDGSALGGFLSEPCYAAPRWAALFAAPGLRRPLAGLVIGFECSFPAAWLDSRLCLLLMAAGAGFHLVNCYVFGLNRFVFAWLAAYPALLFCSQLRG